VTGEAYNIESGTGIVNIEVAVRMLELCGYDPKVDYTTRLRWIADRPFNDHDYYVNGSKLARLGWVQKTPFEEAGLKFTVEWYRKNLNTWWPNDTLGEISGDSTARPAIEDKKSPMETTSQTLSIAMR
jgi:dTDP-D-glucose 4,6-dehydratase